MIIQSANVSEVHKLYVNQSMDLDTPVTVPVERDREYLVFVFAIREGMGILGSREQYVKVSYKLSTTIHDYISTRTQSDTTATLPSGMWICVRYDEMF